MKKDIYQEVTNLILNKLEQGVCPWRQPWKLENSPMNSEGRLYQGVNALLLSMQGFSSPYFFTFNKVRKLGGQVKKGSKSLPIVFWSVIEKEEEKNGIKDKVKKFILKHYRVFNLDQTEGLEQFEPEEKPVQEIKKASEIVENWNEKPQILHEGGKACFLPSTDQVFMPRRESFVNQEEYYSTLFHELIHSTGHSSRLNRKGIAEPSFFGGHEYSKEELIAEMGSCFLATHAGIESMTLDNSASYLKGWIQALKNDNKLLIQASGKAEKATRMILGS